MSSIGSVLGIGGGTNGANYQAQSALPNVANPIGGQQAQNAVTGAQGGIDQQQAFLNALQGQNGIGNQSSVFNQLQGVANGTGPNPAQAMLNQTTGQNVANQAALMAGQRGASQNAGLIAREAAQQGANTQQQAAGQAAAMQANQSLGALGQLGGLANQQVAQQQGALTGLNSGLQNQQGALLGQLTAQNQGVIQNQGNMNSANAGLAGVNAQTQGKMIGGALSGAGAAFASGGVVPMPMFADGGMPVQINTPVAPQNTNLQVSGPKSAVGKHLSGQTAEGGNNPSPVKRDEAEQGGYDVGNALGRGVKSLFSGSTPQGGTAGMGIQASAPQATMKMNPFAQGGKVPALVSPGERYLKPDQAKAAAQGKLDASKAGEKIPGKPKVKGNSYANDTVPKTLDAGGVVIPKSIMESKNPSKEAARFVQRVMAESKLRKR